MGEGVWFGGFCCWGWGVEVGGEERVVVLPH